MTAMPHTVRRLLLLALVSTGGCGERNPPDEPPVAVTIQPIDYSARMTTVPGQPLAGEETRIELKIGSPSGPAVLESIANNPVHLVAVDRDLTWYEHVHPKAAGDTHVAHLVFPADGEYILHVISWPTERPQFVQKKVITVGDQARQTVPSPLAISPREVRSGAYTVRLRSNPEPPATGDWSSLTFSLSRDGHPVTNLTPTGTLGHMVILREGGEDFVYAHSADGEATRGVRSRAHLPALPQGLDDHRRHIGDTGPEVTFHTRFPTVGKYAMWVEFVAGSETVSARFVVDVTDPRPLQRHVD